MTFLFLLHQRLRLEMVWKWCFNRFLFYLFLECRVVWNCRQTLPAPTFTSNSTGRWKCCTAHLRRPYYGRMANATVSTVTPVRWLFFSNRIQSSVGLILCAGKRPRSNTISNWSRKTINNSSSHTILGKVRYSFPLIYRLSTLISRHVIVYLNETEPSRITSDSCPHFLFLLSFSSSIIFYLLSILVINHDFIMISSTECRPCSVKESLEMFCSSDFVARGSISAIYNDAELERTLLTVRATRVIRQASSVFQPINDRPSVQKRKRRTPKRLIPIPSKWKGMDGLEEDLTGNEVNSSETEDEHTGTLHVPLTCQVKHGSGEFIFMGRKRLGDAVLWCAPRLEEWQQWILQAQMDGSAQCRLEAWSISARNEYHLWKFSVCANIRLV